MSLTLFIQLDIIDTEKVADSCSISELLSEATLCNDLAEGDKANREHQRGSGITLVYAHLMLN